MLKQKWKNLEVVIDIPRSYKRFPDWDGEIPQDLLSALLALGSRVRVHRSELDYGEGSRLLFSVADPVVQPVVSAAHTMFRRPGDQIYGGI